MKGYKTRGNASRDKRGRAVSPSAFPTHPDRATRLVGLIAAGALGGLGGGLAVGFATAGSSGLSVAAVHHDSHAATTRGSGARPEIFGSVLLTSSFSEALISPLPSASPSGGNEPVPSPTATASPTPGGPNAPAPSPTPSPTPTPTPTKTTSHGKTPGKGKTSGGNKNSGSGLGALDLGSAGGGQTPLVNVPGVSPEDPTGLFPTVSPASSSSPGGKGKRIDAVTTAATTQLDTLIPGQVVGLAVLVGAIGLAFVRFSLRTPPASDSQEKSQ